VKWAALAVCLGLIIPLSGWLRHNPRQRLNLWMLLGFLPFVVDYLHLYMAIDSNPLWGGYVKGVEVSGLDLIAAVLYLSVPGTGQSTPFRFSMALYFLATVLSAFQAFVPTASLYYSWQLARMFLMYATVTKGCIDPKATWALMKGMGAALVMEACLVIWQRFGQGLVQTGGTVGHQNLLGLMSHMVILPFFALLLAGRRGPVPVAIVLVGAFIDISTASRGVIGFSAAGFLAVFSVSAAGRWTPRKTRALLIGALAMAVIVPAVIVSFEGRFNEVPLTEDVYDEREAYKAAATMMISDHPMGIGANSFAVIGNMGHYYDSGDVVAVASSRAGNVHNIYYLVTAETGYIGLITLLVFFISPVVVAFRCGWRNLRDDRGNLLIGFGVALLTVYFHSWLEWSLATFPAEYLLAMTMGLVAANARALEYWGRVKLPEAYGSGMRNRFIVGKPTTEMADQPLREIAPLGKRPIIL
jgi:O-antigen ligase